MVIICQGALRSTFSLTLKALAFRASRCAHDFPRSWAFSLSSRERDINNYDTYYTGIHCQSQEVRFAAPSKEWILNVTVTKNKHASGKRGGI
jgi:hypothetical protein